jgi:hypothetical protein
VKLSSYMLAVTLAAPALAWSQLPTRPAPPEMKAAFARMQANVGNISGPLEKERWQANVALWQVRLGNVGRLEKADLDKMQPSFDLMKENVAKITEPAEKERWQLNRDLWQITLSQTTGKISSADMEKIKAAFDKMQANIARITGVWERGRWQANRDLWQGMMGEEVSADR